MQSLIISFISLHLRLRVVTYSLLMCCVVMQGCTNSPLSSKESSAETKSLMAISLDKLQQAISSPSLSSLMSRNEAVVDSIAADALDSSENYSGENYANAGILDARETVTEDDFIESLFPSLWVCSFGQEDSFNHYSPTSTNHPATDHSPADIWHIVRNGFQLDSSSLNNRRIERQFNWYVKNQAYLDRVTQRSSRYLYHVVEEIKKRDMPMELALLPIVESAYDPFAYSHGRASGMWQFIPATGRHFGLKQNWWYDGRRDIVASTNAALTYLSLLHQQFDNDWLLALAAYNAGQGNVSRAIRRNKRLGKPTDFWSLKLPKETQNYAPKLIALAQLVATPEKYGITLKPVANLPYFTKVDIAAQIDLAQAANLAQVSIEEIYKLNPGFNRWATAPDGPYYLLVPTANAKAFSTELAKLPSSERLGWTRYKIRPGDALLKIARKHHTSVDILKEVNRIKGNRIRAGDQLLIPVATEAAQHYSLSIDERIKKIQNSASGRKGAKRIVHTVKPGDSFWSISRKYGVKVRSIARWNGLAPRDILRPQQKLTVWVRDPQFSHITAPTANNQVIRKVGYKVRRGDSLARIANKFNIRVADIVRWNTLDTKRYLQPGQGLTLYLDVRNVN